MIPRIPIPVEQLTAQPYALWDKQWLVLTAGDYSAGQFNAMTVSWGFLGVMWDKMVAQVVVRPHRYTYQFIEKYPTFTLCVFASSYRPALNLLGTRSGRDGDKIKDSGLTPEPASRVAAPCFEQAELVLECSKLYWQDLDPAHFLDPQIDKNYPRKDYHRVYFGEVLAVAGIPAYIRHM
jgi:flavin reductase (DIM6/NTAB) family NADH-FMN oxidoreductase RutF